MAHTRNWDNTDPADTDEAKYGAQEMREFKTDVEERLESVFDDIDDDPLELALPEMAADPDATANKFKIYAKDVGGVTTLFRRNSDGISVLEFPSGTKMLFYQDTAPTGWTIQNALDDKVVYITKGSVAGGETGGGAHSTGSWTISGLSGASHTLTTSEVPAHTHFTAGDESVASGSALDNTAPMVREYNIITAAAYSLVKSTLSATIGLTSSSGGGGGHTHTVSSDGTWRPAAYCCIIAEKN